MPNDTGERRSSAGDYGFETDPAGQRRSSAGDYDFGLESGGTPTATASTSTISLSDLVYQAKVEADLVTSQFIADDQWKIWANSACRELYDLLVASNEDYYTIQTQFTVGGQDSNGDAIVALPDNTYKLRGVDWSGDGTGQIWLRVQRMNFLERGRYQPRLLNRLFAPHVRYDLKAGNLYFLPAANAAGTYRCWTVPTMPPLVNDVDLFDGVNGFEEYAVVEMAIRAMGKEESDPSLLMARKEALKERIKAMAAPRDYGEPETIADTRNRVFNDWDHTERY